MKKQARAEEIRQNAPKIKQQHELKLEMSKEYAADCLWLASRNNKAKNLSRRGKVGRDSKGPSMDEDSAEEEWGEDSIIDKFPEPYFTLMVLLLRFQAGEMLIDKIQLKQERFKQILKEDKIYIRPRSFYQELLFANAPNNRQLAEKLYEKLKGKMWFVVFRGDSLLLFLGRVWLGLSLEG